MILSASYKTDIPAYYGDWFLERLKAGTAAYTNPYNGQTVTLDLGSVEAIVFWTRNAKPFSGGFARVREMGLPFAVQFTVTGYPDALETGTVPAANGVAQIRLLSRAYGSKAVIWRYDPVLFTAATTAAWHRRNFTSLARELAGSVETAVLSFAQIYRKTRRNLDKMTAASGLRWEDPPDHVKSALLADLAAIAGGYGISAAVCGQPDLAVPGAPPARCIDHGLLSDIAGRDIRVSGRSHRPTCGCHAARDIGAYESCAQGCVYCYAVADPSRAREAVVRHRPADELIG